MRGAFSLPVGVKQERSGPPISDQGLWGTPTHLPLYTLAAGAEPTS